MKRCLLPVDFWRASISTTAMIAEAQMVIAMRTLGMFGWWNMDAGETYRMVAEKHYAARDSGLAAASAIWRGASPHGVAMASVIPVRNRTRANVRRLARKGPVRKV